MIQKLEQYVIGANYGCGGASFSEVIDKVNEVIDYINSLPEGIPPCQTGFKADPVGRRGRQGMVPRWISEKAEEYQRQMEPPYDSDDIISAYESGAMWQKSQMLKDAVEGKVFMSFAPGHNQMVMADVDLPTNTKVKLIIVKED